MPERQDYYPYQPLVRMALIWFLVASTIGLYLSVLLVFPDLNRIAGAWTYGRWVPLHLNFQLYGWVSMCLLGLIFRTVLGANPSHDHISNLVRIWSIALLIGGISWLNGRVTGKIFLDWDGSAKWIFIAAMVWIWVDLVASNLRYKPESKHKLIMVMVTLAVLATVPPAMYFALRPDVYPALNPDSGGPTGVSLFGSTLGIVMLFLSFPFMLGLKRKEARHWTRFLPLPFAAECLLFVFSNHGNQSHQHLWQIACLALLLPWPLLLASYLRAFSWEPSSRIWIRSLLVWMLFLFCSAFIMFLPGMNEKFKFTNGLVAHAHLALGGLVTSFCMLILQHLPAGGAYRELLGTPRLVRIWNACLAIMVFVLLFYGWVEGHQPWKEVMGTPLRTAVYSLRMVLGLTMVGVILTWVRGLYELEN